VSYLTLAVPIAIKSIAKRVAMSFEPDSGVKAAEYDAFSLICTDEQGAEYAVYGAPVEPWVAESAPMWKLAPDQLRVAAKAYNDVRFPDEPDLSITSIKKFTDVVLISTAHGTAAGLAELGLTIKASDD
jgi:hypothetical protein